MGRGGERWVSAGAGNRGIVSTGDHATNIQTNVALPAEALRPVEEVAAPRGLVNLPSKARLFVGRTEELAALETALSGTGGVVVAAVHGLGGIGKSTLAARYALTHAEEFAPVWWITADTGPAVQAGLAGLAAALQPELAEALSSAALAQRALSWLAAHEGWLLVLDDVGDPADVEPVLDRTLAGRVLITSRLGEGWHRLDAQVVRLDTLTEADAVDLLTRIATRGRTDADLTGAADLVGELGHLPLAVEQAAAYLRQNHLSPRAYLDLLAEHPAVMYDRTARGADAERTIARVWRLTLDRLADVPVAGHLLRVLAWYGPEPIPWKLLTNVRDVPKALEARGALAAYDLVGVAGETVTVHPLVQAVARTPDPGDPHRRPADIDGAREVATALLSAALPGDYKNPRDWPTWRMLAPHIDAIARNASPDTDTDTTAKLLTGVGTFLGIQGADGRAVAYHERALACLERVSGADHWDTLRARLNLAGAHREAGDLMRAARLFKRTLADFERTLGDDHPDTLRTRDGLAGTYKLAGNLGRAVPLFERTLADRERVLGPDHPDTLRSRNNLAYAYEGAGQVMRAFPLFERTLADRERVLGPDHPDTLVSRHNLAHALHAVGEFDRVVPLLERTLADRERVLGPDHPDTLVSRNDLAYAYRAVGEFDRANRLFERALADCERVLGAEHPLTRKVRRNLGAAR